MSAISAPHECSTGADHARPLVCISVLEYDAADHQPDPEVDRFRACRSGARSELSRLTGHPADELPVQRGPTGRPELAGTGLRYSLERRGDTCALATSWDAPVGVDVERIAAAPQALVEQFLPACAQQALNAVPEPDRPREFALWWARITAAVKACDSGLEDATRCLDLAPQRVMALSRGRVVAVACRTDTAFDAHWHPVGDGKVGHNPPERTRGPDEEPLVEVSEGER